MKKPQKLSQSPLFWIAFLIPIALGGALFIASIISNESRAICFTSQCINIFFDLYKFPLSLIGLTVPLTAIVASLHRSEEAHRQIEETVKQNTFNNYIKHREDFNDFLSKIETKCQCQFTDPVRLYRTIFPRNNYATFQYSAHAEISAQDQNINAFLETLRVEIFDVKTILYSPNCTTKDLVDIIFTIHDLTRRLHLKPSLAVTGKFPESKYVWPENFAITSTDNLKTIQRELYSFSFYKSEIRENRELLARNLRLPDAYGTQIRNGADAARLAVEVESEL